MIRKIIKGGSKMKRPKKIVEISLLDNGSMIWKFIDKVTDIELAIVKKFLLKYDFKFKLDEEEQHVMSIITKG